MIKINKYELTIDKIEEINDALYDWNMKYFSGVPDGITIDDLKVDTEGNIFAPTSYSISGDVFEDNDLHTMIDERTVDLIDYEKMSISL
jgi:hypothetical protein